MEVVQKSKRLPKSSKMVFEVLIEEGPLSSKEIVNKVTCSTRSVRYALKTLLENDFVERQPCLDDMRKTIYFAKLEKAKGERIAFNRIT